MPERLLLDTHVVIWSALDPDQLSVTARAMIEDTDNIVFVSPVTAMEIATKVRIGKLDFARPLATGFTEAMAARGFTELPLTALHAEMAGGFASANNDPWDRLLAAQARGQDLTLLTNDGRMSDFGARLMW